MSPEAYARGEPEPDRSPRRSEWRRRTGRKLRRPDGRHQPGASRDAIRPPRPGGKAFGPDQTGTTSGEQGNRTPWACVAETRHRARGRANRQGREKRRRRTEAGVEARDEARREQTGESRPGNAASGSGFPGLGAPEGRQTSREDGREQATVVVHRSGSADGEADEVLEGERKARSAIQVARETERSATLRKTPGSSPQGKKGEGGAAKPNERLRSVVTR
jgi:hypothetical protein